MRQQFNITGFREGQKEIIDDVMDGKDVLGVLPTGSGKSLCYQFPASIFSGLTIVVSPLISLMEDQVKQLKASGFKDVVALNSFMRPDERASALKQLNQYRLIYLSPELLQQDEVIEQIKTFDISLFVIDEAHCISQWGHEFRPDYLRLGTVLNKLHDPPVLALSATATKEVQNDIISSLERPEITKHIYPMDRENITFVVEKVNSENEKRSLLNQILQQYKIPALIYFSSKRKAEETAAYITEKLPFQRVAFYHGGMDQMDRITIQQQFMNGQLDIICCTSAFGMGINKQNIRLVVHYHFPLQIESFLQEIGRAGRDGKSSVSLLLYAPGDEIVPNSIIHNELPAKEDVKSLFNKVLQMASKNKELPPASQVIEDLELNDVQGRFLYYQMEKHGIMDGKTLVYNKGYLEQSIQEIVQFIDERTAFKKRKLYDIFNWIHADGCLRERLYIGFQDSYKTPLFECCSNCGFTFENWEPDQIRRDETMLSWHDKLKELMLAEGFNNETK
ncbi:RecQ family ATP-dependent DNA helicase [Lentibacillus persicus]|uniref:RecQ family ATP-dependent DNA helicase n=1 Tax=Lentibacillus persicus TaxID=640948 RepID=UPI001FDFF447|nr:RecQ family ATP-dependent DNA helicase [Lentibacillus persicus]